MSKSAGPVLTLGEIARQLGGDLIGSADVQIARVAPLDTADHEAISFLTGGARYRHLLETTQAAAVIVGPDDRDATERPRIVAKNPYAFLARVSGLLNPPSRPAPGIHPQAAVHPDARVAASASVGPCAVIEAGATVGDNAVIGPGAVIGARVSIGDDTVLYARAVVYHDCVVGRRCVLHSGVVIGADGFGIAEDAGRWIKVPQVGRVVMGDDVEIGANTTIDRGALDDTVIEDGVKMDNLVQIGHNVTIGAHTAIAGCAGVAGSTKIGRHCRVGGAAMIHGHIEICDGAIVAGGTVIRKNITEPILYTGTFPGLPHQKWMKNLAHFNRLDKMADALRELKARVEAMEKKP